MQVFCSFDLFQDMKGHKCEQPDSEKVETTFD